MRNPFPSLGLGDFKRSQRYLIFSPPLSSAEKTAVYIPLVEDQSTPYPYEISGNNVDGFIITVTLKEGTQTTAPVTGSSDNTQSSDQDNAQQ